MSKLYARIIGPTLEKTKHERAACMERICRRQEIPSNQYQALPWQMSDLPGTIWRNVHTAELITVQQLGENRWGKIGPDPWASGSMFSIGLWRDNHFCIEHWVRVDHLPAEMQIEWAIERVAHCRTDLLREQKKLDKAKKRGRGITCKNYSVGWSAAALK